MRSPIGRPCFSAARSPVPRVGAAAIGRDGRGGQRRGQRLPCGPPRPGACPASEGTPVPTATQNPGEADVTSASSSSVSGTGPRAGRAYVSPAVQFRLGPHPVVPCSQQQPDPLVLSHPPLGRNTAAHRIRLGSVPAVDALDFDFSRSESWDRALPPRESRSGSCGSPPRRRRTPAAPIAGESSHRAITHAAAFPVLFMISLLLRGADAPGSSPVIPYSFHPPTLSSVIRRHTPLQSRARRSLMRRRPRSVADSLRRLPLRFRGRPGGEAGAPPRPPRVRRRGP